MICHKNYQKSKGGTYLFPIVLLLMMCMATISSASAQIGVDLDDSGTRIVNPSTAISFDLAQTTFARGHQILPSRILVAIGRLFGKVVKPIRVRKQTHQGEDRRQIISAHKPPIRSS